MTHTPAFRKSLMAIALASAAMGSAHAQTAPSSVTLYGAFDATVESVKAEGATAGAGSDVTARRRVQSNSSFFGIRGSEEIAPGVRAKFQFETNVNVDGNSSSVASPTGASTTRLNTIGATRDTFVGIQSDRLGELRIGHNTTPYRSLGLRTDFNPSSTGVGSNASLNGRIGGNGNNPGFDDRLQNSVHYQSPSMAGLSIAAVYGANEARRSSGQSNNHTYGLGAGYTRGDLHIGYAYERRNDALVTSGLGGLGSPTADVNAASIGHRLGAIYDFKVVKLGAVYDRSQIETFQTASFSGPLGKARRDSVGVMAAMPVGPGEIVSQYTRADNVAVNGVDVADSDARMFSVGYNYPLSKRTVIKAIYSQINNSSAASYDFFPQGGASVGAAAGSNPRAIGLGLRHAF